jgi:hypothetical protein
VGGGEGRTRKTGVRGRRDMVITNTHWDIVRGEDMRFGLRCCVSIEVTKKKVNFVGWESMLLGKKLEELFSTILIWTNINTSDMDGGRKKGRSE